MTMLPAPGDAGALLQAIARIDSRNPSLAPGGPGEERVARYLADVLTVWGFAVEVQELAPGRCNVLARIGKPNGRTLMFNGHLDVVDVQSMVHAPFDADLRDGLLYGRGTTDMKGGVAAMCAAAWRARDRLDGELLIAAVADEEYASIGTRRLVQLGIAAEAAIVTEPTRLAIGPAHRGFTWMELEFRGRAAHGSRYDLGVDAIAHAARYLQALDQWQREALERRTHPLLGHASLHASTITGGSGWSTYPERCLVQVERRTLPGEREDDVVREFLALRDKLQEDIPVLDLDIRHVLTQYPSDVSVDARVVRTMSQAITSCGEQPRVEGVSAWTDAALLNAAGIPAICYGPGDMGLAHADEEYIALNEVERATRALEAFAILWFKESP